MGTIALRPIDQLDRDWAAQRRSSASRTALRRLADAEPAIAEVGAVDLGDLVAALRGDRDRRAFDRGRAPALLQAMLRSQHVHPLVPRAILQAILPGLVSIARRLSWGSGGEWDDGGAFFVDALTTAWEVIVEWSGEDRDYAVLDILSAVRCRLRRQLLRHRARIERTIPSADPDVAIATPRVGQSDLDELARAIDDVTGHGLDAADAAVLYAHRVLGYTMTELAKLTGRSRRHLGDRRERAVQALTA
jgi:hypothetical protein